MRVKVWYGLNHQEVLQAYAPAVAESITASAPVEVIGCRISRDGQTDARRLHVVEEEKHINHWVACVSESDHEGIGHALLEETSDDETETFQARYRSVDRIV